MPEIDLHKRGIKKVQSLIGQKGSGKNTSSGIIDIALVQSVIRDNESEESIMICRKFFIKVIM